MNATRIPFIPSCMGGWCKLRDHCAHYHVGREGTRPSERLCTPGRDGESDVTHVHVTKALPKVVAAAESAGVSA